MSDNIESMTTNSVPDVPQALQNTLSHVLEKGRKELTDAGVLVPFSGILVGNQMFIEQHDGKTPRDCFAMAEHAIEGAKGAVSYGFCYDGYIDTSEGRKDAVIAEGGMAGDPKGHAIGYIYEIVPAEDGGKPTLNFEDTIYYIGDSNNFMADLPPVSINEENEADSTEN